MSTRRYGFRSGAPWTRRISSVASAMLALVVCAQFTVATPASAGVVHAIFWYSGSETGSITAIGKLTSFSAPVAYKRQSWSYSWNAYCQGATVYVTGAVGNTVSCQARGPFSSISGIGDVVDISHGVPNCFGTISKAKGGAIAMGGTIITRSGGVLRVTAGPPGQYGVNLLTIPSTCYPPENINYAGNINTVAITPNLLDDGAEFTKDVNGVVDGWVGSVKFDSRLTVEEDTSWHGPAVAWVGQVLDWIAGTIESLQVGDNPPPPPTVVSPTSGQVNVSVEDEDPTLLASTHQSISSGTPSQLNLVLSSATRQLLAGLTSPPTIKVSVVFTPTSGRPSSSSQTFTPALPSTITSVSFEGTSVDPTIVVHGRGLGNLPPTDPSGDLAGQLGCPRAAGTYGSDFGTNLSLSDVTGNWGAGRDLSGVETDCVGIVPVSYTSSAVTFKLGSFYATHPSQFSLKNGDSVQIVVNGAWLNVHVKYGATVSS